MIAIVRKSFVVQAVVVLPIAVFLTCGALPTDSAGAIVPPEPTYAWALDEGAGTTAAATFGGQTASLVNGASWSAGGPLAYAGNYAVDFVDDRDQLRLPTHTSGMSGSYQFWAYTTEMFASDYYLHTTGAARLYMWVHSDPLAAGIGINGASGIGDFAKPPDDVWNHVVVTWDESLTTDNVKVYVTNNTGQTVSNMTKVIGQGDTGPILLGYPGWGDCGFQGLIDEVAFWDVPLSGENVQWLYGHSVSTIPEPMTAVLAIVGVVCLPFIRRRRDTPCPQ